MAVFIAESSAIFRMFSPRFGLTYRFQFSNPGVIHTCFYKLLQTSASCNYSSKSDVVKSLNKAKPFVFLHQLSAFSSASTFSEEQLKKSIDAISEKFSEAISLLDDARSSLGTTYFSEDMKDAEDLVNETLNDYENLLGQLGDVQRTTVLRSIGLKINELKAQMQIVRESVRD